MQNIKDIETSCLRRNLEWFKVSGVMDPSDGSWGMGERVVLTANNPALGKMISNFPSHTFHSGHMVFEHRRPDCNFEGALMFLLAAEVLGDDSLSAIGDNILRYLHRRSGLRNDADDTVPPGMWRWAAGQWTASYWIDDNSWNGALSMLIGRRWPELDEKYLLIDKGLETISSLEKCVSALVNGRKPAWNHPMLCGMDLSPHFVGLALMAFAHAWKSSETPDLRTTALGYLEEMKQAKSGFSSSEHGYYLMGTACCASALGDKAFIREATSSADHICSIMSPEGIIPSEHEEAPIGKHLVDTIYTQNWCSIGLHSIWKLTGSPKYRDAYERSVSLLTNIQDDSLEPHLKGCWRGMYDTERQAWGGGDKYEGGANSIYSGWTNAPISFMFAMDVLDLSLLP